MRPWRFLLGPGLVVRLNALFLGYVMNRSRLVPRVIPAIGLVGALLILASATGTNEAGANTAVDDGRGTVASGLCPAPPARRAEQDARRGYTPLQRRQVLPAPGRALRP